MNTRDEMADESVAASSWFGFDQLRLTDGDNAVIVTIGSPQRWDKSHLRRLRQSADLPGLVPVVDADQASDGKPYAVAPAVDADTLSDRIPPSASEWPDCAAITEAAARALHDAHLRGLFHGALSPDQIHVLDSDVAVAGVGLGLGGEPSAEQEHWVAPEVREGSDATERSDVYSLGKVLEASLGQSIDDVPRSVRRLIMWSSSDTPEARPPSALEFASILAEALGDDRPTFSPAFIPTAEITDLASTASETAAAHVPSSRPSTGGVGTAAGAAVAGAGAASLVSSLLSDDQPGDQPPDAVDTPPEVDPEPAVDAAETVEVGGPDLFEDPQPAAAPVADAGDLGATTAEVSEADIEAAVGDTDGDFDSRQYSDTLDTDDEGYDLPAAAQTVDLPESDESGNRSNWAGILIGGILALGLLLVAYQLLTSDSDGDTDGAAGTTTTTEPEDVSTTSDDGSAGSTTSEGGDDDESASGTPATADDEDADEDESAVTSTTDPSTTSSETTASSTTVSTTTTASTTTTEPSTTTTEPPTTTTEAPPTSEADQIDAASLATGPIAADDAGLQILHGIPGVDVDVYLNGEALVPGFTAGTIAGPADLDPGTYDVALFAATDSPPVSADDRTDDPLLSDTVTVGADPASLVAHLDADGDPTLSAFVENLTTLAPGKSRIEVRHLAAAPEVELSIDGEPVDDLLQPGQAASVVLDAGDHTLAASTADGTPVQTATLTVSDGELASVSLIGSADAGIEVAVQRFTGLGSAPEGVPTGDSDVPGAGDLTGLYLLAALASLMAAGGGVMMVRRSRRVL